MNIYECCYQQQPAEQQLKNLQLNASRSQPRRVWVNQPSTLQCCHEMHGLRGLAVQDTNGMVCFYYLEGAAISCRIPASALSEGWPETPHSNPSQPHPGPHQMGRREAKPNLQTLVIMKPLIQ